MEKEQARWERMAAESAAEAARMEAVRASGMRGKTNQSSEHFNIITLGYHNSPEGHTLQYKVRVAWLTSAGAPTQAHTHTRERYQCRGEWQPARTRSLHSSMCTFLPLHVQDEVTRYRSMLRSQNLFNKNHSVPHNIITGEVRHCPETLVPPAPLPPQHTGTRGGTFAHQ